MIAVASNFIITKTQSSYLDYNINFHYSDDTAKLEGEQHTWALLFQEYLLQVSLFSSLSTVCMFTVCLQKQSKNHTFTNRNESSVDVNEYNTHILPFAFAVPG